MSGWAAEIRRAVWLGLAFVSSIVEVSVPHFGFAFVGAGAIVAAAAAFLGFSVPVQIGTFVVVMTVSLGAAAIGVCSRLGGKGVPSRPSR